MTSHQEDIASQLLHSSDARIAEAAKRVFSSSLPAAAASLTALSSAPASAIAGIFDESTTHTSGGNQSDVNNPPAVHPLHGGAEHTANITPGTAETTAPNDEVVEDKEGSGKKPSSTERLKRSRERNRMHARKTRQRKKEHMQKLQNRADELKLDQIRLKQAINEKNTASILVGLFQNSEHPIALDPKIEVLLKRSTEDIPDASKIPELPALILPGQHNGKRKSTDTEGDGDKDGASAVPEEMQEEMQEDGIDYTLLGKDRSSCTPAELDQIRRERNRMHAKRTRDRKRIFMEEMEVMIKQLEEENALLQAHAKKLNATLPPTEEEYIPQAITPELAPMATPSTPTGFAVTANTSSIRGYSERGNSTASPHHPKGDFQNQIESLLAAAGSFQNKKGVKCEINAISCAESDVTASTGNHSDHNSFGDDDDFHHQHHHSSSKRQRMMASDLPTSVPKSITTTNYSL